MSARKGDAVQAGRRGDTALDHAGPTRGRFPAVRLTTHRQRSTADSLCDLRILRPSLLDQASNHSIITPTKGGTMPCMKRGVKKAAKKTAKKTTKK